VDTPQKSTRAGCAVCCHVERKLIDGGLALGYDPRLLSRKFKDLSRQQIRHHLRVCLGGDALVSIATERGWIMPEEEAS
jgi:hypothetical protein